MLLIQAWWTGKSATWNYAAWSLSAELAAYILFPLIIYWAFQITNKIQYFAFSILSIVLLAALLILRHNASLDASGNLAVLRCFCEFTAGAMAFKWVDGASINYKEGLTVATIAVIVLTLTFNLTDILFIPVFIILICLIYNGNIVSEQIFANGIIFWLGEISFSIYLTHVVILHAIKALASEGYSAGGEGNLAIFVAATLCVSSITFVLVERPGQALGRRLQRASTESLGNARAL